MLPNYVYHPVLFYFITMSIALVTGPLAVYARWKGIPQMPLILFHLCVPGITALIMIFTSQNEALIGDFIHRLFLFNISAGYLAIILFFMPAVIVLATTISLFLAHRWSSFLSAKSLPS